MSRRRLIGLAVIVCFATIAVGGLFFHGPLLSGLSSARREPPAAEVAIATWLLRASVPQSDKLRTNPLGADPADIAAGQEIFKQKCEICHGYDGSGRTEIGSGQYPRPPDLRAINVTSLTDGELFYYIRNGIRNTGMPAWNMPDREIWQVVAYLRHLPRVVPMTPAPIPSVVGLLTPAGRIAPTRDRASRVHAHC